MYDTNLSIVYHIMYVTDLFSAIKHRTVSGEVIKSSLVSRHVAHCTSYLLYKFEHKEIFLQSVDRSVVSHNPDPISVELHDGYLHCPGETS